MNDDETVTSRADSGADRATTPGKDRGTAPATDRAADGEAAPEAATGAGTAAGTAAETDRERLERLFMALDARDPEAWAASELSEDIPQLARFMLLRQIWRDVDRWRTTADRWVAAYRDDPATAEVMAAVLDAGVPPRALGMLARAIALETAFSLTYWLSDPRCDDAPDEICDELPGWALMETTSAGELTSRLVDSLYEDLGGTLEEVAGGLAPARERT